MRLCHVGERLRSCQHHRASWHLEWRVSFDQLELDLFVRVQEDQKTLFIQKYRDRFLGVAGRAIFSSWLDFGSDHEGADPSVLARDASNDLVGQAPSCFGNRFDRRIVFKDGFCVSLFLFEGGFFFSGASRELEAH